MRSVKQSFNIFKNIKRARVSSDLSQKELAKKLGVSDKTVSAYETGRAIPPSPTLAKIAQITQVDPSEIMGIKNGEQEITRRLKNIEKQIIKQKNSKASKQKIKIDAFVGVVLTDNKNRIFLIKEEDKHAISLGRWNLPGGSVDDNESLVEAAVRETKEETGYKVKISLLLGCYKCKKGDNSWIYTVFSAKPKGKSQKVIDPAIEKGKWFTKDEFLKINVSKLVHPDMKLVYKIAIENQGLSIESVKYIDYDKE